jgi:hypothetical protein
MYTMDYQIEGNTRRCAVSGKELQAGEKVFSVLIEREGRLERQDYSAANWQGPPDGILCFWTSTVPSPTAPHRPQFDDELLLDCFHRLEGEAEPEKVKFRYVVGLLLMRRRRLKFEESPRKNGQPGLRLRCVRSGETYDVVNPHLTDDEILSVQQEVFRMLGWE